MPRGRWRISTPIKCRFRPRGCGGRSTIGCPMTSWCGPSSRWTVRLMRSRPRDPSGISISSGTILTGRFFLAIWRGIAGGRWIGRRWRRRRRNLSVKRISPASASRGIERQNTLRCVTACDVRWRGPRIVVAVEGTGFLWQMVRIMVGTLVDVGLGQYGAGRIREMLAAAGPAGGGADGAAAWVVFAVDWVFSGGSRPARFVRAIGRPNKRAPQAERLNNR